ncbi:MAG: hypothetical protein Q8M24_02835 [Pseudolabrys sp.]|nr:hypothetical protein [Pseudolabrys sp.]MDP2294382.1 hypothetical protein [Pseudolabrys sp.]
MGNIDGTLNGLIKLALAAAVAAGVALSVFVVVNQMALDRDAADRRALIQRDTELTRGAVAPGSPLSCLDAGAGETIEAACEARVFAGPQSTAAAVAYIGARLTLLEEAAITQPAALKSLAAARRAVELDRYGIAAHVLAARDGCTPERCPAFAWLTDANALKANMKAQAFDQYVSRHAAAWNAPAPAGETPAAVSAAPPSAAPAPVKSALAPEQVAHPVSSKYTLPSAASIPPVSIMNAEPPLPKGAAEAQAAQPNGDAKADPKADDGVPMPPKRPQAQGPLAAPAAPVR